VDDMTVQADGGPPRGPRRLARAAPYVLGAAVAFGAVVSLTEKKARADATAAAMSTTRPLRPP